MNKLAIISSRFPYPLDKGDKLRLFYQLKGLSQFFEIVLISIVDDAFKEVNKSKLAPYCKSIYTLHLSDFKSKLNVLKSFFIHPDLPGQCAYFYDRNVHQKIKKILIDEKPDHLYFQLIRVAKYLEGSKINASLDLMDAFSYGAMQRKENASILHKWFWTREEIKIKAYEKLLCKQFDHLFIISPLDKERVSYLDKEIEVINNGIDKKYFLQNNPSELPEYEAVFVGNMGYYPNIKAVEYIVNKILPAYRSSTGQELTVNIAGPNQEKLNHLNHPNLIKSGWYEKVSDAYYSGRIFLAPLFEGIGQQNKILESMALGVPCITSSDVADALSLKHDMHLLVANTPQEYCNHINVLLNDSDLVDRLTTTAKEFVEHNYMWKSSNQKLLAILKNSMEKSFE